MAPQMRGPWDRLSVSSPHHQKQLARYSTVSAPVAHCLCTTAKEAILALCRLRVPSCQCKPPFVSARAFQAIQVCPSVEMARTPSARWTAMNGTAIDCYCLGTRRVVRSTRATVYRPARHGRGTGGLPGEGLIKLTVECWVPGKKYRYLQKVYDGTPRHAWREVPRLHASVRAKQHSKKSC